MTRKRIHKILKEHSTRQYSVMYKHIFGNNHKTDSFKPPNILGNDHVFGTMFNPKTIEFNLFFLSFTMMHSC